MREEEDSDIDSQNDLHRTAAAIVLPFLATAPLVRGKSPIKVNKTGDGVVDVARTASGPPHVIQKI